MKKYAPYILILIVLAGFFGPVVKAQAQDATKYCFNKDLFYDSSAKTEADCKSKGVGYNWWTKAEVAEAIASARQRDPLKKFCYDSGGSNTGATTESDCLKTTGNVWRTAGEQAKQTTASTSSYFNCGILDLVCKTAQLVYYIIFIPMSAFTWLAAKLLDFFVYYSTNSSSYSGEFVSKAWAAVRDIANIFFIIALLYVAIKTILGLNVTDNKKLISAVVVVALIINFSLFTTKLVIDGSNIVAKIFYNNITSIDENGKALNAEDGGQKSISVGLVKQFDPQTIFGNNFKDHEGLFIFVTILSILIMGFMIYIFLSIALLFVGRVVALWLYMIFSPIAFASYTVPFEIPGFGHKEWWSELVKNSLMAPVFIFFLYIIILFGDALKSIPYDISSTTSDLGGYLDTAMKSIIPFIIIYILLKKAKELAVKYSGEIGEGITKFGAMAGGLALGAATGGVALAGRATIGRMGAAMASSGGLKAAEAAGGFRGGVAKQLRNFGKFAGGGSMDIRGVKIGGKGLADTGLTSLGKPQEGGFIKRREDKVAARQKRAKELEVGEDEGLKQNVYQKQNDLDKAKSNATTQADITKYTKEVTDGEKAVILADREVAKAERELKDQIDKFGAASTQADLARSNRNTAVANKDIEVDKLDKAKDNLKNAEKPIKDAEKELKVAQNAVIAENRKRRENYANTIQGSWSQTVNFITSGGQHSPAGEREAANKILAGIQEEKK